MVTHGHRHRRYGGHAESGFDQAEHGRDMARLANARHARRDGSQRLIEQQAVTRGLVDGHVLVFVKLAPRHAFLASKGMVAAARGDETVDRSYPRALFSSQTSSRGPGEAIDARDPGARVVVSKQNAATTIRGNECVSRFFVQ